MNAVLFDLDNTLWYSPTPPDFDHITRLQAASIATVLPAAGNEAFVRAFWMGWQQAEETRTAEDFSVWQWSEAMAATCLRLDVRASDVERRRTWEAINAVPRTAFNTEPIPGAIDVLAALKRSGWRTAIVTNHPVESALLRQHIEACGLAAYIDAIVSSADIGVQKPDPRPFLTALEAVASTVGDAVMVGDSLEHDIVPAINLGLRGIHLSTEREPVLEHPHARIGTLRELPALLGLPTR